MGQAIGGSLALAIGVALSPVPIITVALMLTSRRARVNGPLFVLGWLAGLAVVGAIALSVAGPAAASSPGSPATWVSWLKVVLGLLLLVGVREFRAAEGRRAGAAAEVDGHDRRHQRADRLISHTDQYSTDRVARPLAVTPGRRGQPERGHRFTRCG